MHYCVPPRLDEDDVSEDFVQVDVVVQREDGSQSELPHLSDGVT